MHTQLNTRRIADRNTVYMHVCERNHDTPGGRWRDPGW